MDYACCTHKLKASILMENLSSSQRKAPPLKPSEAFLRLPPLLPCGDLALLAPIVVYRQYPGASAQICKLQVYHARQARQGLMSLQNCRGSLTSVSLFFLL